MKNVRLRLLACTLVLALDSPLMANDKGKNKAPKGPPAKQLASPKATSRAAVPATEPWIGIKVGIMPAEREFISRYVRSCAARRPPGQGHGSHCLPPGLAEKATLRLPAPATEGQVYLMLFPEAVKASDWKNAPAEFRGGRSFQTQYGQPATKSEIEFRINPARPGRYWLKAVWDRKPPFSYNLWSLNGFQAWLASTNNAIAFGPGDAESGAPAVLEINAQQSVTVVRECRTID